MNSKLHSFSIVRFADKPSWENWRRTGLTAEDTAILMGENPWHDKKELLERKCGILPPQQEPNQAMIQAKAHRPVALETYRQEHPDLRGIAPANLENNVRPWLRAHVDLFHARTLHIAEVRCGQRAWAAAKDSPFPGKPYWAEAQHILAVTGLKFLHIYHHTGEPNQAPITLKVWRKDEYVSRMIGEAEKFLREIEETKATMDIGVLGSTDRKAQEVLAAQEAFAAQRKEALAVYQALLGKAPRVDKETYRRYVPTHFTRSGKMTDLGKSLLLP
jgi:putative phage-type endonuclease